MKAPLLLVTGDFGKNGGMDWANREVARYFAAKGHPVHLVGFTADDELVQTPNIFFHPVPKPLGSYFLGFFLLEHYGLKWAMRIQAEQGRVIVNGGNCVWGDVNWVHYLHVRASHATPTWFSKLKLALFQKKEREALKVAKVVITTAESNRRDLEKYFSLPPGATHVVPLGIDPHTFFPAETLTRSQLRTRWNLKLGELALCFVGSLDNDRKGFDVLYEAWKKRYAEGGWPHRLIVAGQGAELPQWRARAERDGLGASIQFLGFTKDIPTLLKIADAIAVPSRYEPYSLAAQEAVAAGLPCFISEHCGFADRFPSNLRPHFVLDPFKVDEWKEALGQWAKDPSFYSTEIKPFSQAVRRQTWAQMAEQFETILFPSAQSAAS